MDHSPGEGMIVTNTNETCERFKEGASVFPNGRCQ